MHQQPLALFDTNGLTETKHFAIDGRHVVDRIHVSVIAALEVTAPIMKSKEDLAIVASRVLSRFDHEKTVESTVLGLCKIFARECMGVKPTESWRVRPEGIPGRCSRGNHWCAFFHRTVNIRGQEQAVPVNDLW